MDALLGRISSRGARLTLSLLVTAAVAIGFCTAASSANAAYAWQDGVAEYSQITNCVSIIQGYPYVEKGASAYGGVYEDSNALPGVGQTFYLHIVVFGLGNSCSGQRFYPEVHLPAGLQFAITPSTPVQCWGTNFNVKPPSTGKEVAACPQTPTSPVTQYSSGGFGALGQPGQTWPLPQGYAWEIQFPVVATAAQNNSQVIFYSRTLDGNLDPVLMPDLHIFVLPKANPAFDGGGPAAGGSGSSGAAVTNVVVPATTAVSKSTRSGIPVSFQVATAGSGGLIEVLVKNRVIARKQLKNLAAGNVKSSIKIAKSTARKYLKGRRTTVTLRVTVTPPGGTPTVITKTLKLKR